jgi:3D (Asp-Asp-Asp) domain-containing protein
MKAAATKTVASPAKGNTPFFQKGSGQSFFPDAVTESPFFFKKNNASPVIQTKLTIGQPNDKYEQQADTVADQVMQRLSNKTGVVNKNANEIQTKPLAPITSMITPFRGVQTKCAACEQEETLQKKEDDEEVPEEKIQKKPIFESNAEPPDDEKKVQKKCDGCEKGEELQKKEEVGSSDTPSIESGKSPFFLSTASSIRPVFSGMTSSTGLLFKANNSGGTTGTQSPQSVMQSLGKGSSLDSGSRTKMESAFETSFPNVELHTDSNSEKLSQDMNARAFTVGNHIAFARGEYKPGTLTGDALLAHELAHTLQQSGTVANKKQSNADPEYSALEKDADQTTLNVMSRMIGKKDIQSIKKVNKGLKTGLTISRCNNNDTPGKTSPTASPAAAPATAPSQPTTPLEKPSEMKYELAGAERKKWRVDFNTEKESQAKVDAVRKLHIKADNPEKNGKLSTFYYYPLTETEAAAEMEKKKKGLGDKYYDVKTAHDSTLDTFYLKISFKCPAAVPLKSGFEIWPTCYSNEKDVKEILTKLHDAKIEAERFELDASLISIYYKPFKTQAEAEAAGKSEASKRGGFAEGMFKVTSSATENADLKSYTYKTETVCPPGYDRKDHFLITAYVLAQEKEFPATPTVKDPCGLTGTFSWAFLFQTKKHPRGVKMEGSGVSKSGDFIQYEAKGGKDCFKVVSCPKVRGICLSSGTSVATDTSVIPRNKELLIEDVGARTAHDTGGKIKGDHIDVYFGTDKTIDEAENFTLKDKTVCIKK